VTGRGSRRAAVPGGGWRPVDRIDPAGGMLARFVEERTGRQKTFDFSDLPAPEGMRQWLARAFARRTGPRSGIKRVNTAVNCFTVLRAFAVALAEADAAVSGPHELRGAHFAAFRLRHAGAPGGAERVIRLRSALRDDPELPEPARTALLARPPRRQLTGRPGGYDDQEWQLIMTALRSDARRARDRIRAGRQLLADYREGRIPDGDRRRARLGALLDVFDATGELPRGRGRFAAGPVSRAGGVSAVTSMLCLTLRETTAFCLLLCALTGENFTTVAAWPAVSYQPAADAAGGASPPVALVEQAKPRRGPEREHMVAALEDVPPPLAGLLDGSDTESRWLRSPVRVYHLLVELAETSRRLGGHRSALSAYTPKRNAGSTCWVEGVTSDHVWSWARGNGFPTAAGAASCDRPPIEVRRIRQTVIEGGRRPVSHSRATMNDHYLAGSDAVRAESRIVVGDALREQVDMARQRQTAAVLTSAFLAEADRDPATAADRAGLVPDLLAQVIDGDHDTVLAACAGQGSVPAVDGGQPCAASFLACLDCANARALPRHLPVQAAMADRLSGLAAHLDPPLWRARYQPRLGQLEEIMGQHTAAEQTKARQAITEEHRALVDDVLAGRWDLR